MKIQFWGTRGSIPAPGKGTIVYGGNTACVEVRLSDGTLIVLDSGTGIRKLGYGLSTEHYDGTINLLLTHSHWDHIQGFPFFLPAYDPKSRLNILGCNPGFDRMKEILIEQMEARYFPVNFKDLNSHIEFSAFDGKYKLGKAVITPITNNHPYIAYGYKIEEEKQKLVFLTDNELLAPQGNNQTTWAEFVKFCAHADLLIHDAQFTPEEIKYRCGWGHSTYEQAVNLAMQAKVKNLALFHHDPEHSDDDIDNIVTAAHRIIDDNVSALNCFAAREGESFSIRK